MKTYTLNKEQLLHTDIENAWDFFSNPQNLAAITPPEIGFKILGRKQPQEITQGMHIHYIVSPLFGIPLRWETLISKMDKPHSFTDVQLRGPYQLWSHHHSFIRVKEGTLMKDEVNYQLPLGILGQMGHFIVRKKLEKIFEFRRMIIHKKFNQHATLTD